MTTGDNLKEMHISIDNCRAIVKNLRSAFIWLNSADGDVFWGDVLDRLQEIIEAEEKRLKELKS